MKISFASSLLYLSGDDGATWTSVTPGGAASAANSQCILYGTNSAINISGNLAKVTLGVGFLSPFYGVKRIWAKATDAAGLSSPQTFLGYYTAQ
jgi:hypothetical protein